MTDEALGDLAGIRLVSDVAMGDQRVVRFATVVAGEERITEFHVERSGTRFGLFAIWRFTVSPVATFDVSADHDDRATANGVELTVGEYPVLVPALVTVDRDSTRQPASRSTLSLTTASRRRCSNRPAAHWERRCSTG